MDPEKLSDSRLKWNSRKMDSTIDLSCKKKVRDTIDEYQHSDVFQTQKAQIPVPTRETIR